MPPAVWGWCRERLASLPLPGRWLQCSHGVAQRISGSVTHSESTREQAVNTNTVTQRMSARQQPLVYGVVMALAVTLSAPAWAAGPPPASYPERFAKPQSQADRDKRCDKYEQQVQHTRHEMAEGGPLSRLGWMRVRHRKMERFLKEYCGHADASGFELSHRAVASNTRPPISQPAITDFDHPVHWYKGGHGGGHGDEHGGKHHDDGHDDGHDKSMKPEEHH